MASEMVINGTVINDASDCFVIAEVGHNHQGNLQQCMKMFTAAKEAGASAVKLQKRDNRALFTKALYNKPYESPNAFGDSYGEHREALEFGREEYVELIPLAKDLGITFFSTAFDFPSADFLAELDMPCYKMASGDLRNTPLLEHVAKIGKPMIISTGGATMDDVQRAYDTIMQHNQQLCILQCTAAYPVEFEEMDLQVISTYRQAFRDVVVGLSAHDNGIAMSVAAYVLGARVVEKHFTLNRAMKGTDHAFSLEPIGLKKLVRDLQRTRVAMGDGRKKVYPGEHAPLTKMCKAICAARDLPAGHVLGANDLTFKSPGGGLHPYQANLVVGKTLKVPLKADDQLSLEHVSERLREAA